MFFLAFWYRLGRFLDFRLETPGFKPAYPKASFLITEVLYHALPSRAIVLIVGVRTNDFGFQSFTLIVLL